MCTARNDAGAAGAGCGCPASGGAGAASASDGRGWSELMWWVLEPAVERAGPSGIKGAVRVSWWRIRNARIRRSPFPARPGLAWTRLKRRSDTSSAMRVVPDPGLRSEDRQLVSAIPIDPRRRPITDDDRILADTVSVRDLARKALATSRRSGETYKHQILQCANRGVKKSELHATSPAGSDRPDRPQRSGASGRAGGSPGWEGPRSSRCVALEPDGCMKARLDSVRCRRLSGPGRRTRFPVAVGLIAITANIGTLLPLWNRPIRHDVDRSHHVHGHGCLSASWAFDRSDPPADL